MSGEREGKYKTQRKRGTIYSTEEEENDYEENDDASHGFQTGLPSFQTPPSRSPGGQP